MHAFFSEIDWMKMDKHISAPPIIPSISAPDDTKNFVSYRDEEDEFNQSIESEQTKGTMKFGKSSFKSSSLKKASNSRKTSVTNNSVDLPIWKDF